MKISDYTVPELEHFRRYCNFTPREAEFFDLRAGDATLEDCSGIMCCSMTTINGLSRKVKAKMRRV